MVMLRDELGAVSGSFTMPEVDTADWSPRNYLWADTGT